MSSQIPALSFHRVSLLAKEEFGIKEVSFKLYDKKKYHIYLRDMDAVNCLMGLIEKRYQPESGIIKRETGLFCQSDRLLLEDKIISKEVGKWLGMDADTFYLGQNRKSKWYYVDLLKAKSILYRPVYKLKKDDRIKFSLLSLLFQGNGIILIQKLIELDLDENMQKILFEILIHSHNLICVLSAGEKNQPNIDQFRNFLKIFIS